MEKERLVAINDKLGQIGGGLGLCACVRVCVITDGLYAVYTVNYNYTQ